MPVCLERSALEACSQALDAGGLDMAVEQVFGGRTVWHCETGPAASKVLSAHWPDTPNLDDITAVDWSVVEPVDIICGGWPCQPFSLAGRRKGADDERALWLEVARAVRMVRPRIVVLENVTAVLGPEFSRVADSLAALGYDLAWTCLRASDIGAPHRRDRLFIAATDTAAGCKSNISNRGHETRFEIGAIIGAGDGDNERSTAARVRQLGATTRELAAKRGDRPVTLLPTPQAHDAQGPKTQEQIRTMRSRGPGVRNLNETVVHELLPTPSSADGDGGHLSRSGARSDELLLPGVARAYGNGELLPTPTSRDGKGANQGAGAHGDGGMDLRTAVTATRWGKYESAIRRWESLIRPAPSPTEPNRNGNPRLNPEFSSWMMGWPASWVTGVPGISRNDMLRCIGNGVVPQCAMAALRSLLSITEVAT
jgi:DNA (cytosine-5)-methyltransferase 1